MQVKQLSIMIDPRPERLAELMNDLMVHQIELHHLTITNDANYTIFKGLAPDSRKALKVLQDAGYTAFLKDVLAVGVVQGYDSLVRSLSALAEKDILVEYCSWVFNPSVGPFLLMVVKDLPAAQTALVEAGYRILSEAVLCQQ